MSFHQVESKTHEEVLPSGIKYDADDDNNNNNK